jgi:hypothetical protein
MIINFKVFSFGLFQQDKDDEIIITPNWGGEPCADLSGVADPGKKTGDCTYHVCTVIVAPHNFCWTDGAPVYYCKPKNSVCYKDATGLRFG